MSKTTGPKSSRAKAGEMGGAVGRRAFAEWETWVTSSPAWLLEPVTGVGEGDGAATALLCS